MFVMSIPAEQRHGLSERLLRVFDERKRKKKGGGNCEESHTRAHELNLIHILTLELFFLCKSTNLITKLAKILQNKFNIIKTFLNGKLVLCDINV